MLDKNDICGIDTNAQSADFTPNFNLWNSMDFLSGIRRSDILLSQEDLDRKREFLYHATYTEFDAENLCRHIDTLSIDFTPEFKIFEQMWRRDEWNHYIGFRQLYSVAFGQNVEHLAQLIEARPSSFSILSRFFEDEFKICLLIAFDEILTAKGYASEFDFYASFGNEKITQWFRQVTRDEGHHFRNAMEVIRLRHKDRIGEISQTVDEFVGWDQHNNAYTGTFVFDHDLYSQEFISQCAHILKTYFK